MNRRNFLGLLLGTIGALPFVKAETFLAPVKEIKSLELRGEFGKLYSFDYAEQTTICLVTKKPE